MDNFFVSLAFFLTCIFSLFVYYLPFFQRFQVLLLVCISFFIYWLAAGNFIFLLAFCSLNTSLFSYKVAHSHSQRRSLFLIIGVVLNVSLLVFFKYKRLLVSQTVFTGWFGNDPTWLTFYQLALPIGISFFVFHAVSMIVDSYNNPIMVKNSENNFFQHMLKTTLYLNFFPQLVAGPIAKGQFFYPQITPKYFKDIDWVEALRALIHGYFLKEVVANNLNQLTTPLGQPDIWALTSSKELLWMAFGYSAQIFSDFAGYSLIAIGLGRLFGYELPMNFNSPYFAHSFANFWQRWHISLSNWLRDYVYIPLGGNRKGKWRLYANLMIVMAIGGLWHGPEWKFATWGLIHGLALAFERLIFNEKTDARLKTRSLSRFLRIPLVFLFVTFAWLFFKLNSVQEVISFIKCIASWKAVPHPYHHANMVLLYIFTGIVFVYHAFSSLKTSLTQLKRYDGYLSGAMALLCLVARGQESAFIYFQF